LVFQPSFFFNWQMVRQSSKDCCEAAGEVSSMYSTPKSASAVAILILVSVSLSRLQGKRGFGLEKRTRRR
jgi:hypothetical protein